MIQPQHSLTDRNNNNNNIINLNFLPSSLIMTLKRAPSPASVKLEAPGSTQITPINSDNEDEDELLHTTTPESNHPSPASTPNPSHTFAQLHPNHTTLTAQHHHHHHHHHHHPAPSTQSSPEPQTPNSHHRHQLVKLEKVTEAQLDRLKCLIKIIRSGNFNEFSEMLQEKTFNNLLNVFVDGQTALHYSLLYGRSLAWCKQLVLSGANPNLTNRAGWHPIHLAAFNGSLDTMRYLIDYITS